MSNALQGSASFTYGEDEETFNLTINNKVLLDAEDVLGYSALDAVEEAKNAIALGRNPMLRTVIAIFYGALAQNHPELSQDDAIDMFMDDDRVAQKAFLKALEGTDIPRLGKKRAAAKTVTKTRAKKSPGTGKKST